MDDSLRILPLAITMMAGPQIVSAVILTTAPRPVRVSLGFLSGVAAAVLTGVAVMFGIGNAIGSAVELDGGDNGSAGQIIQYVLIGLLAVLAVRNWVTRRTAEPPAWLGRLMSADPRRALEIGFLLVLLMPSDLMIMLTVGVHLAQHHLSYAHALPFVGLTLLVAALPLLALLLAGHRAEAALPKVRDWAQTHSWLINIAVCVLFILLILF